MTGNGEHLARTRTWLVVTVDEYYLLEMVGGHVFYECPRREAHGFVLDYFPALGVPLTLVEWPWRVRRVGRVQQVVETTPGLERIRHATRTVECPVCDARQAKVPLVDPRTREITGYGRVACQGPPDAHHDLLDVTDREVEA